MTLFQLLTAWGLRAGEPGSRRPLWDTPPGELPPLSVLAQQIRTTTPQLRPAALILGAVACLKERWRGGVPGWEIVTSGLGIELPHDELRNLVEQGLGDLGRPVRRSRDGRRLCLGSLVVELGFQPWALERQGPESEALLDLLDDVAQRIPWNLEPDEQRHQAEVEARGLALDRGRTSWLRAEGASLLVAELLAQLLPLLHQVPYGEDPLAWLDTNHPSWRSGLPVPSDDASATSWLDRLAARLGRRKSSQLLIRERTSLHDEGVFTTVDGPARTEDIDAFWPAEAGPLPSRFTLVLRSRHGEVQAAVVTRDGPALKLKWSHHGLAREPFDEISLVIRHKGQDVPQGQPLPTLNDRPWLFAQDRAGWRLARPNGDGPFRVGLAEGWTVEAGVAVAGPKPRAWFDVPIGANAHLGDKTLPLTATLAEGVTFEGRPLLFPNGAAWLGWPQVVVGDDRKIAVLELNIDGTYQRVPARRLACRTDARARVGNCVVWRGLLTVVPRDFTLVADLDGLVVRAKDLTAVSVEPQHAQTIDVQEITGGFLLGGRPGAPLPWVATRLTFGEVTLDLSLPWPAPGAWFVDGDAVVGHNALWSMTELHRLRVEAQAPPGQLPHVELSAKGVTWKPTLALRPRNGPDHPFGWTLPLEAARDLLDALFAELPGLDDLVTIGVFATGGHRMSGRVQLRRDRDLLRHQDGDVWSSDPEVRIEAVPLDRVGPPMVLPVVAPGRFEGRGPNEAEGAFLLLPMCGDTCVGRPLGMSGRPPRVSDGTLAAAVALPDASPRLAALRRWARAPEQWTEGDHHLLPHLLGLLREVHPAALDLAVVLAERPLAALVAGALAGPVLADWVSDVQKLRFLWSLVGKGTHDRARELIPRPALEGLARAVPSVALYAAAAGQVPPGGERRLVLTKTKEDLRRHRDQAGQAHAQDTDLPALAGDERWLDLVQRAFPAQGLRGSPPLHHEGRLGNFLDAPAWAAWASVQSLVVPTALLAELRHHRAVDPPWFDEAATLHLALLLRS